MVKTVNITKKTKIIVGTILTIVVLIFCFGLIKRNIDIVEKNKGELNDLRYDLKNLDKILKDTNENKNDIESVLSSVPRSYEEISQYAKKLDYLAGQLGLNIGIGFDKKENKETNGLNSLKVEINTAGQYSRLVELVSSISELPYHIEVDSIKFNKTEGTINLRLTYRLFTYIDK